MKTLFRAFLLGATCFASIAVVGQERMTKVMAGPSEDKFRILVSFMNATDDSYKLQSLIIDVNRTKEKQPTDFYVDLTSTVRSLTTGAKKQWIYVLRWGKSSDLEVKCDGGKWVKPNSGPEIDKIVETVKAVLKNTPWDAKKAVEITLPNDVEQKVTTVLNGLETSTAECIRGGS